MATQIIADEIAKLEKVIKTSTNEKIISGAKAKLERLKSEAKGEKDVSAKELANALLKSRKKFLEMSNKDFKAVIARLAKKPEYSFLKGYSRQMIEDDIKRKAKPTGWRFKGRGDYRVPTEAQRKRGRSNGTVYFENRPNRMDISQARQLAKGGIIEHGLQLGDTIVQISENPEDSSFIWVLNNDKIYTVDLSTGYRGRSAFSPKDFRDELNQFRFAKGGSMSAISMADIRRMRDAEYQRDEDGGEEDESGVIRYYFEEEPQYAENGSNIDLNDLNIPVHYTMFEEEMYEYGKGGGVDKLPANLKKRLDNANKIIVNYGGRPITVAEAISFNSKQMPQSGWNGGFKAFELSNANLGSYRYATKKELQTIGDALIDISREMSGKDIYAKGGGVGKESAINAALERKYPNWEYPVPPVSTARWGLRDWSNWIEKHGRKK